MLLIPSAFFEVLFEPITDLFKSAYNNVLYGLKWFGICLLYLFCVGLLCFTIIGVYIFGSEICKHFGV